MPSFKVDFFLPNVGNIVLQRSQIPIHVDLDLSEGGYQKHTSSGLDRLLYSLVLMVWKATVESALDVT